MISFCIIATMDVNTIFSLVLIFAVSITSTQLIYPQNNECRTPNNRPGACISIKSCPYLLLLLLRNPITQQTISFLRKSQCGREGKTPKVCCEANSKGKTLLNDLPIPSPDMKNYSRHGLNDDGCGIIRTNGFDAVAYAIGGEPAKINEFPWMALLVYDIGKVTPGFLCGGSIINSRYILTAAHCVTKLPTGKRLIGVRVGEYNLRTDKDCTSGNLCNAQYQDFGLEEVVPHSGFSHRTLHNDIALIRLDRYINFNLNNVQTICLPVGPTIIPDKFTVTGWGIYNDQREHSAVIQKVELPRYLQDQCANIYKRKNVVIWHKQICAGGMQGVDGCEGDSGGPLQSRLIHNNEYRTVQYGIVSFGTKNCGTPGIPGVYTRIDYYIDWILYNIRD